MGIKLLSLIGGRETSSTQPSTYPTMCIHNLCSLRLSLTVRFLYVYHYVYLSLRVPISVSIWFCCIHLACWCVVGGELHVWGGWRWTVYCICVWEGRCMGTGMANVVVRWGLGTVQLSECFRSIHHSFFFFRKGRGREKTKVGRNGREEPVYSLKIFWFCIASLFLSLPSVLYLQCIHFYYEINYWFNNIVASLDLIFFPYRKRRRRKRKTVVRR